MFNTNEQIKQINNKIIDLLILDTYQMYCERLRVNRLLNCEWLRNDNVASHSLEEIVTTVILLLP